MPSKKKKECTIKAEVTFEMKVIIRDGVSMEQLLKNETEFLAEPQSTNGCVTSMKIKDVK